MSAGETVLLLGESGSGKSTLLSLICGTVAASSGVVAVEGTDNLLPFGSVIDNILLPLRFAPERRGRVADPKAEARQLIQSLGLPAEMISARAGTLSVGQQQRVAAARALIGQPPLIIADEPTSALDAATQTTFLDLLFAQSRAHNTALLMVSHDARLADHFDRVVEMADIARVERAAA